MKLNIQFDHNVLTFLDLKVIKIERLSRGKPQIKTQWWMHRVIDIKYKDTFEILAFASGKQIIMTVKRKRAKVFVWVWPELGCGLCTRSFSHQWDAWYKTGFSALVHLMPTPKMKQEVDLKTMHYFRIILNKKTLLKYVQYIYIF